MTDKTTPSIPLDRINELYRGEIFTAESARVARDRIHWMCRQCEGTTVLDVGCSQGITSILLAREGFQVTAIDSHPDTVAYARAEIARESEAVRARITLLQTDLADLPDDARYDTVVLGEVIEHQVRPMRMLQKAGKHLRPGGRMIVTTPFGLHPHDDHKVSIYPADIQTWAYEADLSLVSIDADGRYIQALLGLPGTNTPPTDDRALLDLTQRAAFRSQAHLYRQLSSQSEESKKRAVALKTAQQRNTEAAKELAEVARQHAQAVAELAARHETDLQGLRQKLDSVMADNRAALNRLEEDWRSRLTEAKDTAAAAALTHAAASAAQRAAHEKALASLEQAWQVRLAGSEANAVAAAQSHAAALDALGSSHQAVLNDQATRFTEEGQRALRLLEVDWQARCAKATKAFEAERREHDIQLREVRRIADENLRQFRTHDKARLDRLNDLLKEAKTRTESIRQTFSFRLGHMIIFGIKSPRSFFALPWKIWQLRREHIASKNSPVITIRDTDSRNTCIATREYISPPEKLAMTAPSTSHAPVAHDAEPLAIKKDGPKALANPKAQPKAKATTPRKNGLSVIGLNDLNHQFAAHGVNGLEDFVRQNVPSLVDKAATAQALLELGANTNDPLLNHRVSSLAIELDRSDENLLQYFLNAQEAHKFKEAAKVYTELENRLIGVKSTRGKQQLKTIRASAAHQYSVLDQLESIALTPIETIPNRVCYILHNSLPYSSGGYATRSHGVASGLRDAGYEILVLSRPGFPTDTKPELAEANISTEDVIDGIRYIRTLSPSRTGTRMVHYVADAADALEVRFRELKPSVVIAASNHVTGLPALIAAKRLGITFIYEIRGLWEITRISRDIEFRDTPAYAVQSLLEATVAQRADHVFTLTNPMKEEMVERDVAADKIELLPNSCDPERFEPRGPDRQIAEKLAIPAGVPVIGYIGTFVGYEGLEDLTAACVLLKQRGVAFRLLLVGNENTSGTERGSITEDIVRIAEAGQITDWLIMPGRVPHDQVESYYSLIDIAPFPRKPLPVCEMVSPMKPLEALAMEKAVLVSSVRALTEMIADRQTGRVFEKGSIESLADTLQEMIADPAERAALGKRGRAWVIAERTWKQMGQRARRRIDSLLQAAKTTA